jgi:hypothetical protein
MGISPGSSPSWAARGIFRRIKEINIKKKDFPFSIDTTPLSIKLRGNIPFKTPLSIIPDTGPQYNLRRVRVIPLFQGGGDV